MNKINKIKIYMIFLAIAVGCSLPVKGQGNIYKLASKDQAAIKLSIKAMRSDLDILWSAIKEVHPGYNYFTSADSLRKAYSETYSSISRPLYESEFISQLYPFISKIRCGHTQIKHSKDFKDPIGLYSAHLPFKVFVSDGKVFITSHETDELETGDEIISINGVVANEIIEHGSNLYSTDGYNVTFKELFLSEYDGFEDACNKYYRWQGPYRIRVRTKQNKLKDLVITTDKFSGTVPETTIFDNFKNWTTAQNTGNLTLRFFNSSPTALFETKPFSYNDTITYKEVFKQIDDRKIKNLVLDMRHNTGGDIRVAIQLLSYLADGPFNIIKDVRSRLPAPASNSFAGYFDKERTAGFLEGYKITNKEGLWYHVETRPAMGTIYGPLEPAKDHHFDGDLYVLIDGATFSSGALFTSALKSQRKNIKFIGRETAGGDEGCNGMVMQELTLPNTGIMIDFPWMRVESVATDPVHGHGIMPEYKVTYSPMDIVIRKDRDLEKAIELILQQSK